MVDINRQVDITDILVLITDNGAGSATENDYNVRLHSVNHAFGYRVSRHSQLAVALNLSRHLSVPAILPGPGLNNTRWWMAQPDGKHRLVTLNESALAQGRHQVDELVTCPPPTAPDVVSTSAPINGFERPDDGDEPDVG